MFLYNLIEIVQKLLEFVNVIVIVMFVLSLLLAFNVVNRHNRAVDAIWTAVNALLEPVLRPLRKILPDTRPIDFSPMALVVLLWIVSMLLDALKPYA